MQFDPRDSAFEAVYECKAAAKPTKPLKYADLEHNGKPTLLVATASVDDWPAGKIIPDVVFDHCDFRGDFSDLTFRKCTFDCCSFASAKFSHAKFSGCTFAQCTFTLGEFVESSLIDCKYSENWASNEHYILTRTDVSAKAFLDGISPNLRFVNEIDPPTTAHIQKLRAMTTVSKLARKILNSTEASSNEELYDEAYGSVVMASIAAKIAEAKLDRSGRHWLAKTGLFLAAIRFRVEYLFLRLTGLMTRWRTGVLRPASWGILIIAVFID